MAIPKDVRAYEVDLFALALLPREEFDREWAKIQAQIQADREEAEKAKRPKGGGE